MYKLKLWDEDKWDIHSSSYNSTKYSVPASDDKKDGKKYHEAKYATGEKNMSSDYMRSEDAKEKDEKSKSSAVENWEEDKIEPREIKEEDISFRAAKQVFDEKKFEAKDSKKHQTDFNTIEDAIKKAIEEEKKVIILDN